MLLNAPASTAEVWFDGQLRYSGNEVSTDRKALARVQPGAAHSRQMGDTYIDDVSVTVRYISPLYPVPGPGPKGRSVSPKGEI